jgi:hypothetical protein
MTRVVLRGHAIRSWWPAYRGRLTKKQIDEVAAFVSTAAT